MGGNGDGTLFHWNGARAANAFLDNCGILFRMNAVINHPLAKKKSSGTAYKNRKTSSRVLSAPLRVVPKLSRDEESFLSGITTSGQFTIQKSLCMYDSVRPLRNVK